LPSLQLVPKPTSGAIADSAERGLALDITRSWIVEAPAGSGKTGLLIQRFLKLLASPTVDEPSQILAITFTRKATSEMLDRVLGQLASAAAGGEPANPFDRATRGLAEDVLSRDRQLGWELRDHPTRLNIRTIDSISAEIANGLPVLSGSGGGLAPSEDGALFHAEGARPRAAP
jgi:ATP-dependent helicase/nuclease subunit A